jgi:hypothetical protein
MKIQVPHSLDGLDLDNGNHDVLVHLAGCGKSAWHPSNRPLPDHVPRVTFILAESRNRKRVSR